MIFTGASAQSQYREKRRKRCPADTRVLCSIEEVEERAKRETRWPRPPLPPLSDVCRHFLLHSRPCVCRRRRTLSLFPSLPPPRKGQIFQRDETAKIGRKWDQTRVYVTCLRTISFPGSNQGTLRCHPLMPPSIPTTDHLSLDRLWMYVVQEQVELSTRVSTSSHSHTVRPPLDLFRRFYDHCFLLTVLCNG